jgi:hypothetical protein
MQELEILMPWTWVCVLLVGRFIERVGGLQVYISAIIGVGGTGCWMVVIDQGLELDWGRRKKQLLREMI